MCYINSGRSHLKVRPECRIESNKIINNDINNDVNDTEIY